jgi:sulfate adenylyltransferase (ADP) / ATP adenylyltransferase
MQSARNARELIAATVAFSLPIVWGLVRSFSRGPATALPDLVSRQVARALSSGALKPFKVEHYALEEEGIPVSTSRECLWGSWLDSRSQFQVSFLDIATLALKPQPKASTTLTGSPDAFEVIDEDLRVPVDFDSHHLVLNKFPILPGHLVLPTKRFEPQEHPLTMADFVALWRW